MTHMIKTELVAEQNDKQKLALDADYTALGDKLARRGEDIERLTAAAGDFAVALPSWGVGTGGTRFARFPGLGEPRNIFEKLDDCSVIHQLSQATPTVSLHIPWDRPSDPEELKGDRKSTRLNSSHVRISYAVFCLKKK